MCGVLKNVCACFFSINVPLHYTVLVDTNSGQKIKRALVAGVNTIEDESDNNLLPSWTTFVPELRPLQVDNVFNILHDTMQSSGCEHFVFIVICDRNEQLSVPVVHCWAQIVTILQGEIVGIACGSGVWWKLLASIDRKKVVRHTAHVREFLTPTFKIIAIFGLD